MRYTYHFSRALLAICLVWSNSMLLHAQQQTTLKPNKKLLKQFDACLQQSAKQYAYLMKDVADDQFPRTYENGKLMTVSPYGWTSGFYPGSLLYLYEYTGNDALLQEAKRHMKAQEKLQTVTTNHDLGFMMYCSFGNAYRLFQKPQDKAILIQSAKSLASRFYPKVGSIKSWDKVKSLDGVHMLNFPVIIDNMMNLELLFFASKATGDPVYKNMAITHANTTIKNHLRPDYSCYHVVNYDEATGKVLNRETQQGFSDNSTWSRGQAWGIYGFTMVYRETGDQKYLQVAQKMTDFFLDHDRLPADKIPYWDFNVGQPGYVPQWKYDPSQYKEIPRDASAAAITASALIELAAYVDPAKSKKYFSAAETMLTSLSSKNYRNAYGENGGFILKHSSGGVPGNAEVDVPLSYADYYYLEALMRYHKLGEPNKIK